MKRLVLYVTSEQLRTILPLVVDNCVDVNVSDIDPRIDKFEPKHTTRSYDPRDLEVQQDAIVETTEQKEKDTNSIPVKPSKRKIQRRDVHGRQPWQVCVDAFTEKNRVVMSRQELTHELELVGFGRGTTGAAINRAIKEGELRALNNCRYSINNPQGKRLKSLKDLDVSWNPKTANVK